METLAIIDFSKEEKEHIVPLIQRYLREELDCDVGSFDAEFLLDFFSKEIGGYMYNRALTDVHALLVPIHKRSISPISSFPHGTYCRCIEFLNAHILVYAALQKFDTPRSWRNILVYGRALDNQLDSIAESIYALEKPVTLYKS